jgi:hypothetical protein
MPQTRRILACDGGGIRGIITLHCLKALEERLGVERLCLYFDMFAGTSTGAMIAGSLAAGAKVSEVIDAYVNDRRKIYTRSPLWLLWPLATKYRKGPMRRFLRKTFEDKKLGELPADLLITAVDTVRSEITFFSSFKTLERDEETRQFKRYGTYKDVRLRDAVEASASAPTYFKAHGRFIDGGSTVYINPAYVAAVEALRYSSPKGRPELSRYYNARIEVYSFSTGVFARSMEGGEAMDTFPFDWIEYLIEESSSQAGEQQSYIAQRELELAAGAIVFNRHDLYLTPRVIWDWAPPGCIFDPDQLALDAVDEKRFALLSALGQRYGEHLFPAGWTPPAPPPAVAGSAAPSTTASRQKPVGYWDEYGKPEHLKEPAEEYAKRVLAEFDRIG